MESLVIKDSPWKNLFWGVACLIFGGVFFYSASLDGSLGNLGLGIGGSFVLGGILFFWPAIKPRIKVSLDDEGVWTELHQTKILWKDIKEIGIESGMLVIEIKDFEKYFPDSSTFTKAILKRVVVDLVKSDTDKTVIYKFIVDKVGKQGELR